MTEILEINEDQLDSYVEQRNLVLLLIWIKRCDQCDAFKPVFEQLTKDYPEATFLTMNMLASMENLRRAEEFEIDTTPIVPVFCNGKHLGTFVGYYNIEDFKSKLEEIRSEHEC